MDIIRQLQFVKDGHALVEDGWPTPRSLVSLEADGFIRFEAMPSRFERGKWRSHSIAALTSKGNRFLEAGATTMTAIEAALNDLGYAKE